MVEVDQACQLMKRALEILDASGAHQSAALLDNAIHALPGMVYFADMHDTSDAALGLHEGLSLI